MDPWMMGLLSLFGSQNPQQAGQLFDQAGIPPPSKLGGPGATPADTNDPGTGPAFQQFPGSGDSLGGLIAGGGTGAAPAAPGSNPNQLMQLAALQGVKAPAPIQPIMQGGVAGGVKPPEMGVKSSVQQSPAITALMQALLNHPQTTTPLGSLIPRR